MSDQLFAPGSFRAAGIADDSALLVAMLQVEVAWSQSLAEAGVITPARARAVAEAVKRIDVDLASLAAGAETTGNPVVGLVGLLREEVGDTEAVHRGLTSQDVVDTALMLLAQTAMTRIEGHLVEAAAAVAALATTHRDSVMVGRTLTQWAVPITFGLKAAQWLTAVGEAVLRLRAVREGLPVSFGGAAGTRALTVRLAPSFDPARVVRTFAENLGLRPAQIPWHTRRQPVTDVGDALASTSDVLGMIAADVLVLARSEVGEVSEGSGGGSSTMPHKQNPALSVLIRSASMRLPLDAAQLHLAAGAAADERPAGAWHAEWPVLARMLRTTVTASSQAVDLLGGLVVHADVMAERADRARAQMLAESGTDGALTDYLGDARRIVHLALVQNADMISRVKETP